MYPDVQGLPPPVDQKITVAVVQQAREKSLAANRDKLARFIAQASDRGCRLVIFPEDSLSSPAGTSNHEIEHAVGAIRNAAREKGVYVVFCFPFGIPGLPAERRGQSLHVVNPEGRIIHRYNKLISDTPPDDPRRAPGIFHVDGIPCSAMICADRWLRGVEEVPVSFGAKILIDCSCNSRNEWIPEFGWYLPVTRALRNNCFAIFCNMGAHPNGADEPRHGHSAVIRPDGSIAVAADDEGDQMLVATLDLSQAHGEEARRRHNHLVFKPWWDLGRRIFTGEDAGGDVAVSAVEPYSSPKVELTVVAAQMACSRDIAANLQRMNEIISEAAAHGADLVAFPELAVTGAVESDVMGATRPAIADALATIRSQARRCRITVVFGMPFVDGGRRWNSAFAVGPDGTMLTRYDQMVVDRPQLFAAGSNPGSMWFRVKGVPAAVTVGADARWNEIAELAAVRGAQLLLNLSYDQDVSAAGALRRTQFWVQFASFYTFAVTVNAASPRGVARPSAPASGGSALWDDFDGHRKTPAGRVEVYSQFSACRVVSAGDEETLLYAARAMPGANLYVRKFLRQRYPHFNPWYHFGARLIASDLHLPN